MTDHMRTWPTDSWDGDVATDDADAAAQPAFADVEVEDDGMPSTDDLRQALKAVLDPEIGINIVDLGLVYGIEKADGTVSVEMTLTSMGCPLTELLHQQCTLVLARMPGVENIEVNFVFTPPWSTDMISDDAKDELRAMGFSV